jgi:NADH-ubiquinone oxidoreductase chain 2
VSQLRGYFFINPLLATSLCITIFSFVGVPPLIGFFGKQMVLSAALDQGLFTLSLIAILTSVIGAVYYLNIIKEMFFINADYKFNKSLYSFLFVTENTKSFTKYQYLTNSYSISSPISFIISNITLIILLFIFINKE